MVTLEQAFAILEGIAADAKQKAAELSAQAVDEQTAELILVAGGNFETVAILLRAIRTNMDGEADVGTQPQEGGSSRH